MLTLEFPNQSHREMYAEMMIEWEAHENIPTSPGRLFVGENYDEFLREITKDLTDNHRGVNSTLFFLVDGIDVLGAIQIRHHINHPNLQETGGHIGYGIRPNERKKGYATQMLKLGLKEAQQLGIQKVLISCEPDNIASEKVILANAGVYNKTVKADGGIYKTFWITL